MPRKLLQFFYVLTFAIFPLLVMRLAGQRLAYIPLRLFVFAVLVLAGSWLFIKAWPQHGWAAALLLTSLGYVAAYRLASFIPEVSSYPFSLGWSEASRYYYASLWFSEAIYGTSVPPSILHPSRYLLQSLPFLMPGTSLLVHRLWQVVLWVTTTTLTGWLLTRRLSLAGWRRSRLIATSLVLWTFLFLFQGPVYYHLLVMVILVLWFFDSTRPWRSLMIVLIASLWAGISRVNWLPVPGLMAAALYLLEVPAAGKSLWRYIFPPAVWVGLGTAAGYASQQAYQLWSGNPPEWFGSSFTSDLLWYRLLPNLTFPIGILPSAILVSLPLAGLMLLRLAGRRRQYQAVRPLGLFAILLVLFAGGVVVSVKIGGGSNLHNLDAFLALLLIIGVSVQTERFVPDTPGAAPAEMDAAKPGSKGIAGMVEGAFITAAVLVPLYFILSAGGQAPSRDYASAEIALQSIASATRQAAGQGGEVLFINQRHLLTFGTIPDVPLIPEDELVFLMEMAMSGNASYLDAFQLDLSRQRFALIVAEPLAVQYQGRLRSFGEENDAWVERVSEPILCYYQPSMELDAVGVVLYVPRTDPCE